MSPQILTFTNLFPWSGQPHHGRFVQDRMQRVIAKTGWSWAVIHPVPMLSTAAKLGRSRSQEQFEGVTVHHVPYFHIPGLSMGRQARRMAKASLPVVQELCGNHKTLLDAHYVYPDGVAALTIAAQLNLPCVVTARGTDLNVLGKNRGIATQIQEKVHHAHRLLTVSHALKQSFLTILDDSKADVSKADDSKAKVEVVRNGVDLDLFQPADKQAARQALNLPADGKLILGVGRLVQAKGFHHAAAVTAQIPGASLVLAGDGPQRRTISTLLGPDRCYFLGAVAKQRLALAYQACDLLVLPSYREGWPNVVTEALACGLPVVASRVGGIPEILGDKGPCMMVSPGNENALKQAIQAMLESPPTQSQIRTMAEKYSWEQPVQKLVEIFSEALQ